MQTTIHSQSVRSKTGTATKTKFQELMQKAEANRYGIIPMLLMFVGLVGGISIAFGAAYHPIEMAAVVFPTILMLAFMLGITPIRLVFSAALLALIMDALVMLF